MLVFVHGFLKGFLPEGLPADLGCCLVECCRGINFLLTSLIFNVIPTAIEVSLVSGLMVPLQLRFLRILLYCVLSSTGVALVIFRGAVTVHADL